MRRVSSVAASAARTANGVSSRALVNGRTVAVQVDVTVVSGTTPSLAVTLEWSNDGNTWYTGDPADAMTAITAVSSKAKSFEARGSYVRAAWAITGTTPSFTFTVSIYSPR